MSFAIAASPSPRSRILIRPGSSHAASPGSPSHSFLHGLHKQGYGLYNGPAVLQLG